MLREETNADIMQICRWDDKSMELLYDNFYRALVSYGCQFVEREIAEDVVQELFSVLWEQRPQFSSFPQFTSYLYRTVHNATFNHLRHQTYTTRIAKPFSNICRNTFWWMMWLNDSIRRKSIANSLPPSTSCLLANVKSSYSAWMARRTRT